MKGENITFTYKEIIELLESLRKAEQHDLELNKDMLRKYHDKDKAEKYIAKAIEDAAASDIAYLTVELRLQRMMIERYKA